MWWGCLVLCLLFGTPVLWKASLLNEAVDQVDQDTEKLGERTMVLLQRHLLTLHCSRAVLETGCLEVQGLITNLTLSSVSAPCSIELFRILTSAVMVSSRQCPHALCVRELCQIMEEDGTTLIHQIVTDGFKDSALDNFHFLMNTIFHGMQECWTTQEDFPWTFHYNQD